MARFFSSGLVGIGLVGIGFVDETSWYRFCEREKWHSSRMNRFAIVLVSVGGDGGIILRGHPSSASVCSFVRKN